MKNKSQNQPQLSEPFSIEMLPKLPKLGKDNTFFFGCEKCGQCCRGRDDVLLYPFDLFKIASYLKKSIENVLNEYCVAYVGDSSKTPVVRIKPKQYRKTCPFLENGQCSIHPVKPVVCAIYPIGFAYEPDENKLSQILLPVSCGNRNETYTVREWLSEFNIEKDEKRGGSEFEY
jgi:hypothetical protein